MPVGDVAKAVRYLALGMVAYIAIALASGHGIHALELVVFALGIVAFLFLAAHWAD